MSRTSWHFSSPLSLLNGWRDRADQAPLREVLLLGFTVDLQTVEWATLVDRRSDPGAWEAYFTFGSFIPEPSAYSFLVGPGWGQWQPEEKVAILDAYNTTYDPAERVENWSRLQELLYTDVPVVKIGDSYSLTGRSASLNGYLAKPWPAFWNVEIE